MDFSSLTSAVTSACSSVFHAIPFSGPTWFVLLVLSFFVFLFAKAHRDPASPVDWEDLLVDPETGDVSPYRLGYLVGMIVGTWVVVHFADSGKLTWDILSGYFAFLVGASWAAQQTKKPAPPAPAPDPEVK